MVAEPFRKRWTGEEPVGFDSSALCQDFGKQARMEEQRTPNPLLQSSNLWLPAIEGEADGKPPHC